jgi:hypothetical protein
MHRSGVFCHHTAMKKVLLYVPVVLSFLVLGAHFMRYGNSVGVVAAVLLIALLLVRQPWVARFMQLVLILGALEWAHTIYELVQVRTAHGMPYIRMVVILGVVAAVTCLSALLFELPEMKKTYGLNREA